MCALLLMTTCGVQVPAMAAVFIDLPGFTDDVQDDGEVVIKRQGLVDAWSICPPRMADVDCFYAYLRIYARLRKAAQESDRVSMRNIGKRQVLLLSPPPQLSPLDAEDMTSSSDWEPSREATHRLAGPCPQGMTLARCYRVVNEVYGLLADRLLKAQTQDLGKM